RRHGKADDDGGQNQRLGQRIGECGAIYGSARIDNRRQPHAQPPHREDEEIDGIGHEREPDNHLETAWAQEKPGSGPRQDADPYGKCEFHQASPFSGTRACLSSWSSSTSSILGRVFGLRIDWCAMATSMSTVAPTTSTKTPRSKSGAEAVGTSPI